MTIKSETQEQVIEAIRVSFGDQVGLPLGAVLALSSLANRWLVTLGIPYTAEDVNALTALLCRAKEFRL